MNGIEYSKSYSEEIAHLVGWGGDTFQLLQDIKKESGDLGELIDIAKTYFNVKGGFGPADFISDVDAPIILKKKQDDNNVKFSDIITSYYNNQQYTDRIYNFVTLTFPSLTQITKFREELFKIYSSDYYIKVLECQDGLRDSTITCVLPGSIKSQYANHQKAAVYVVSDYLADNYEKKEKDRPNNSALLKLPLILLIFIIGLIL